MGKGWEESAQAWIGKLGEHGDWGREHVLDPVMLGRVAGRRFERALDVGCSPDGQSDELRYGRLVAGAGVGQGCGRPAAPLSG